ncbi:hypothetical protein [Bacillus massiliigorillae]|uniref:hypothetical protein n=1 Tax=Bacillus massiliigorillae TaxID=1243664 RepID=UPI0005A91FBE|nr:hypothetical protein [Bacillus massiliigorillae]
MIGEAIIMDLDTEEQLIEPVNTVKQDDSFGVVDPYVFVRLRKGWRFEKKPIFVDYELEHKFDVEIAFVKSNENELTILDRNKVAYELNSGYEFDDETQQLQLF